ncbi:MAG: hypothetical protein LJE85_00500 [Gammaproteobacteria bacterium]|jgi:hypothetical protein|nr:hypothetical protein [Gammaproteobacteria bacterium]
MKPVQPIGSKQLQIHHRHKLLPMALIAVVIGCQLASPATKAKQAEGIVVSNVVVTETGSDEKNAFCSSFRMTHEQVTTYFKEAEQVTHKIIHDQYDWLPCYVRGELVYQKKPFKFEIRAGGTAYIEAIDSDLVIWFACKGCDKLFGG